MRRLILVGGCLALLAVLGSTTVNAQVSTNDSISVTARNVGIFTFTITEATFDFGDVGSAGNALIGTGVGVTPNGRNGADDGGNYTATSAVNWTCTSAPTRTVSIYNDSSTVVGSLPGDRLQMQIPSVGGGTTTGYKRFLADTGVGAGDLINGMTVGNGSNAVSGTVDFQLSVLDADPTGLTTWTVVLTASGT